MIFEQNPSMLFSDLDIPEVFISEYMCLANGDYVKIYMYALFLNKYGSEISPLDLSKKLCMPLKVVENALKYWEENSVMIKKQGNYILADLKQIEVNKLYKPKLTSSMEDALENNAKNVSKSKIINAINDCFFQGVMSPVWYTDIDNLFSKYNFDDEVVMALFQYCYNRQALHKKYLSAVAEGWASSGIKNMNDLDIYYANYEKSMQAKKFVAKKLGLSRNLSEYEEAYIDKWFLDYKYPLDIIEIALKRTTSKTNLSFDYLDKIITDWHERKLSTSQEIETFLSEQKQKKKDFSPPKSNSSEKYIRDDSNNYGDFSQFYINV